MTKQDFIFSAKRKHRYARHILFWLLWSIAFNLLFHFPTHVFKGWDTSGPGTKNLQELGIILFFIKTLLINSFLSVIVPQMALTYVLIYWLLPKYLSEGKNLFITILVTVCALVLFYFVAIVFKQSGVFYNRLMGISSDFPLMKVIRHVVVIDQLTTLPIVTGFALMIKVFKRWWLRQKETEVLAKEKTKAELQLLKAQVHPHFLFNTLNNIYFFTLTNSSQAPVMIKKLSDLLQYILHECDQPLVPLEKEIKMLRDYMALEKIRYGENIEMTIDVEGNYNGIMIHPLLLIPFVENSFKHGASKMISHPWVKLQINIKDNLLHFSIENSKPTDNETFPGKGNIGLKNVRKRLELLYPGRHALNIVTQANSYIVSLELKLRKSEEITGVAEIKPYSDYAIA
ncbi:MAG: sensor histidine kinase [Candidatus Dadabacteria bacterium]